MDHPAKQQNTTPTLSEALRKEDETLLPISLLDGPTAEEILLALNLRHDWRGFSFGNFWFGYYFSVPQSSPPVEERYSV
jgi:hypothetical protein